MYFNKRKSLHLLYLDLNSIFLLNIPLFPEMSILPEESNFVPILIFCVAIFDSHFRAPIAHLISRWMTEKILTQCAKLWLHVISLKKSSRYEQCLHCIEHYTSLFQILMQDCKIDGFYSGFVLSGGFCPSLGWCDLLRGWPRSCQCQPGIPRASCQGINFISIK